MQVLATIVGICMMGSITMTQQGIQSLKGALYFILIENLMSTTYHAIAFFSNKMPVFFRECTNNVNTPMLFYLSNFISMVRRNLQTFFCTPNNFISEYLAQLMYLFYRFLCYWYAQFCTLP